MFGDGSLTLREFATNEPLPLATIHEAILEFLRSRNDVALFGAQAVNAYVDEPRMTQDVGIFCLRAADFAEELRLHLATLFRIATRVRIVAEGKGFRIFQLREPKNRHLADIRHIDVLPPTQLIAQIRIPTPEELIAQKVIAYTRRQGQPKGATDQRDLMLLLLAFPGLKTETGGVRDRLLVNDADEQALAIWRQFVVAKIEAGDGEDSGY